MQYVSVTQVAKMLGVSRAAVHDRIQRGSLKVERVGNQYAVPVVEVYKAMGYPQEIAEAKALEYTGI